MSAMLEVRDLHVAYGQVEAVRGVSFTLDEGHISSIIGPNGAGKTTLLASLMGLLPPARGEVLFDGVDVAKADVETRLDLGLCLVPEQRELFGDMSVLDNLVLGSYIRKPSSSQLRQLLDETYARFPRLAERRNQRADTLSGGERQMLALSRALMSRPRLLMLDEPSLGLAPLIVQSILAEIGHLRSAGLSVLLVEQNARAALRVSSEGHVIEGGSITHSGPSDQLMNDDQVRRAYLGGE
ncbi:ABC transporter ATP-binding protein [Pusillimonas noertemannii]|uniref:Amino acid/amide ABC transporter ATP-binding protein 2 (HAAT family) n=1 Tax=Pusillimonas noertemannii TaxID=305977 RepID=A0A2U1CLS9_9BURK|nr:ABC transporter ATP-binding protein [Pusillimonas noertemannii]NYT69014.1 ABC transporter ATP-binding protein [Pusillimonas noertemannii]PVY61966.1 amino acid/amide ABC transporter ATP-binding protein 2 (HAAT family) [Pusillimonas noertemannii]TFL11025.1 ABC transporter ATP-binding protein [Pusillimonas noertemannii]